MATEYNHKSLILSSPSRAFGCVQRYIQGPGELQNIFAYGKTYGTSFLFIVDRGIFDMIRAQIDAIPDTCGCRYSYHPFYGECCQENMDPLVETIRQSGCDVVVGVGGGKVLDTVKLVADTANVARIIVPTIASNDGPAADWAAVYDKNGVFLSARATKRNTELVLVDSAIIAKAPARLFAAGIGDALVTWYEAMANERSMTPNNIGRGYLRCRAGMAIARECLDILLREGKQAYDAVKSGLLTPAVEDVIEANILLSGLGFMNAGCAASHGVHNGISELRESDPYLHGEKVAFGLLVELILENAPVEEIQQTLAFLHAVELPITMEQFDVACTDENLDIIVNYMMNKSFLIHREPVVVTAEIVRNAILAANALGHRFLAEQTAG